ncbi:MAG TPA: hypothetical protein VFB62_07305 [Polyangiaceae bacterium]|nr:hypothetical protein [Polyangiaceae bacterium]
MRWIPIFALAACSPPPTLTPPAEPVAKASAPAPPAIDIAGWAAGYVDDVLCDAAVKLDRRELLEIGGRKRRFSVHGYVAHTLRITRGTQAHCISVAWPPGFLNSANRRSRVADKIDDGWFRALENTLARVPWQHVRTVRRIVIDNRPKEHGIAAFDRRSPDDGRDGRTIWLHEHLFTAPNHWAYGNHGTYWSYHNDVDGQAFDDQPSDHALFSPVLLHELGHLVAYNVINADTVPESVPTCAQTCGDRGGCADLPPAEREAGCISPYCMPFRFRGSAENWAEQYRFYYQGSASRALLGRATHSCLELLVAEDTEHKAPWDDGLPDVATFRPSLWASCGMRPCKPW